MANKELFKSIAGKLLPPASAVNEAGGGAYELPARHKLAQYAATGCLNETFYNGAEMQLDALLKLCAEVDPAFVAKTAVYCRERAHMKDTPALLAASLSVRAPALLPAVFGRVVDNGKMLRNFVQILRSGVTGRKSLGSRPKKLVQAWLNTAPEKALLSAAVGRDPSLADVVKMVHPKPAEAWRAAFFAWLIGKPYEEAALPPITRAFEAYKRDASQPLPDVPFQMLTALELDREAWTTIALNANWHALRMNLNTFARHGVFDDKEVVKVLARKLRDPRAVAAARAFPYQLMAAYKAAVAVPEALRDALQDALDASLDNVPDLGGDVVVCPDVSGSMNSPATGSRGSATSVVRCIDVAALVAAALVRKNKSTLVLPFEQSVVDVKLNHRDSVLTNAEKLAAIGGGGTNCSAPLALLNRQKAKADVVVLVSDNQSWLDKARNGATATMAEWERFKIRNPNAKLVCIDVQPYGTVQAAERKDILNVGGFGDEVFTIMAAFVAGELNAEHWTGVIDAVQVH